MFKYRYTTNGLLVSVYYQPGIEYFGTGIKLPILFDYNLTLKSLIERNIFPIQNSDSFPDSAIVDALQHLY